MEEPGGRSIGIFTIMWQQQQRQQQQ